MLSVTEESKTSVQKQKPLRVGDPLGVVLYAYARASQ
jgi:hypothetical protein